MMTGDVKMNILQNIEPQAAPGVHETVLELPDSLGIKSGATVLDLPSGRGAMSVQLQRRGFTVVAGDIDPSQFVVSSILCHSINMNEALPFSTSTFDLVVCVEGIEHTENPDLVIRELVRVTKPKGYILLSTPNIMSLKSRVRFLFHGDLSHFRWRFSECKWIGEGPGHISPVPTWKVLRAFAMYGAYVDCVKPNRSHPDRILVRPIAAFSRWLLPRASRRLPNDLSNNTYEVVWGDVLVYLARKYDVHSMNQPTCPLTAD